MKRIKESSDCIPFVDDRNIINNMRQKIVLAHIQKLHFRNG